MDTVVDGEYMKQFLGGKPFLVNSTLVNNGNSITTSNTLIDTGANGYIFVNTAFAERLIRELDFRVLRFPGLVVGSYDGEGRETIDKALCGTITLQGRQLKNEVLLVLNSVHDLMIGDKWLAKQNVLTDSKNRRLIFPDEVPTAAEIYLLGLIKSKIGELEAHRTRAAPASRPPAKTPPAEIPDRREYVAHDEGPAKMERSLAGLPPLPSPLPPAPTRGSAPPKEQLRDAQGPYELRRDTVGWYRYRPPNVAIVGAVPFLHTVKKAGASYVTSLNEIDHFILEEKRRLQGLSEDEPDLQDKVVREVPGCYHGYLDVFSKAISDGLAERRTYDHKIELVEGGRPEDLGYSPLRKMTLEEMEACKKYITENLEKGFIESSSSPWAAPVLFAKKADGGLRFCVDYRKLNAISRKDRYPLPLIDETLSRISKARIFTKIDIRQAFHKIRMTEDSETLTTFRTRYGAYKYKVMPFGLTNGPATFQRFMNDALLGYIDDFVSAYIDDILIYSDSEAEHEEHVKKVLERLREAGLQADLKKCEFHVQKTKYLGFIVGTEGIAVDPQKVDAVREWGAPKNLKGVQAFLGFCNFYRRFIREYGRVARPLSNLTRKGEAFNWTLACQDAFDELKDRLISAPVLAHFDHELPTKVETDASDGVLAGVLVQQRAEEWHPVAFFSETMHGAEHNYSIHDKELLAVVRALVYWRAELVGLQNPFTVVTDHKALEFFSTKRLLNLRQAGWAELLAQYHFTITYRPGSENAAADALSRKAEDLKTQQDRKDAQRTLRIFMPAGGGGEMTESMTTTLSMVSMVVDVPAILAAMDIAEMNMGVSLIDELLRINQTSESLGNYRLKAEDPDSGFSLIEGRILLKDGKLVVPEDDLLRTRIVDEAHSRKTTAHPGRNKTKKLLAARYWWPGLAGFVDQFVANCVTCAASKVPRGKTLGLLRPLPIPLRGWSHLVVDFKKMPEDQDGYNNTFVMIDRLSKTAWTVPCRDSATAKDAAEMYYQGPFRVHGLPQSIVSDRGPQFIAAFTAELSKILSIDWTLASPGHSQTAGQVEVMNEYLDQRLRPFVNHYQNDWSKALPAMDAVQSSLPHDSTGLSPHEILHGFPMPMQFDWENRTTDFKGLPAKERLNRQEAQVVAQTIRGYVDTARATIAEAQQRQKAAADAHRREPDFDVGDKVFILKRAGTAADRPSDKLDFPLTRTYFTILSRDGETFALDMPPSWTGSNLFHADRLKKYPDNPVPGQSAEQPEAEEIDGEEQWEVDKILASRLLRGKLQYKADWKGYDPDPEWYDAASFKESPFALRDFHTENPTKPGPPIRLDSWLRAAENEGFEPSHKDDNKPAARGDAAPPRRSHRKVRGK